MWTWRWKTAVIIYREICEHDLNAHRILADLLSVFMMVTDVPIAFVVLERKQRGIRNWPAMRISALDF